MSIVYLCLGSNMGDRFSLLQNAVNLFSLSDSCSIIRTSALYETEPWGYKNQEWFLNIIVEIKTSLNPQELLSKCQEIENFLGRDRNCEVRWGERTVDVDILFYGKEIINEPNLTVPHKRIHERAFVLVPLLELIPDFIHPVLNKSISQLYDELEDVEDVYLYGTRPREHKI